MKREKHSFISVKKYFNEQGCELLETEYKNSKTKMKYKCSCGDANQITFDSFKRGSRCAKCGHIKTSNKQSHSFEYVKNFFKEQNCELLEKKYVNGSTKMKYKCICNNISETNFMNFKKGRRCKKCAGLEKYSFKYVENYFLDNECELLETVYKNIDSPMRYRCQCGNIRKITFYHFKNGQRCHECSVKKRSGERHFNYNPNLTDEDREINKSRMSDKFYKKWRKEVFKRDRYTCQKCHQKGTLLNAHHIKSWASNKDLRLASSNGITFCEQCHKQFHKEYGRIDNDKYQITQFLN